jgi:hypothetical protein
MGKLRAGIKQAWALLALLWRGVTKLLGWAVTGLMVLGFGFFVLWCAAKIMPDEWIVHGKISRLLFCLKYKPIIEAEGRNMLTPSWRQTTVEAMPHGCEWMTAPLGDKNCHYEAVVEMVMVDANDHQMISLDRGETWTRSSEAQEPSLFISWRKVEE